MMLKCFLDDLASLVKLFCEVSAVDFHTLNLCCRNASWKVELLLRWLSEICDLFLLIFEKGLLL